LPRSRDHHEVDSHRTGEHLYFFINQAVRSRQLLKSFHNKSLGDKDSLDPTVHDPLHAHMPVTRDASMQQADTKVSLTFSAVLRNVRLRQA
jgi:hypothetical protein